MTNQVYTNTETQQITPVGGQINEYWSKVIIELGFDGERRFSMIKKHLNTESGKKAYFRIVQEGIEVL